MAEAAIAEFGGVGLADDDRVRRFQALDRDIILFGDMVLVESRAEGGADAARQDQVLHRDRDAGERAERARRARGAPRALSPPAERFPASAL